MFDTVKLKVRFITIHPSILDRLKSKRVTYKDHDTGELKTKYTITDDVLPFIEYYEYNQTLKVELSIPKFLYGNNVILIETSDIPLFFHRLHKRLYELFEIHINEEDWKDTERIDVCWNFPTNENLSSYIKELHKLDLPFTQPSSYGHAETVVHMNSSRRICFYDKQKECIKRKEPQFIIDQSKGLLRMEIKSSYAEMRKYSKQRRAVDLLTNEFFEYITKRVLNKISFPSQVEGFSIEWLQSQPQSISKIQAILGFQVLQSYLTENELKQLYRPSTYANQKKLAKKFRPPTAYSLEPLVIDY